MKIYTFYQTEPFVMHDILYLFDWKQVIELMYPRMFYGHISIILIRSYVCLGKTQ